MTFVLLIVLSVLPLFLQSTTMPARKGMQSRFYNKLLCGMVVKIVCISSIIFITSYKNSTIKEDAGSQGPFENCETALVFILDHLLFYRFILQSISFSSMGGYVEPYPLEPSFSEICIFKEFDKDFFLINTLIFFLGEKYHT